MKAARRPTVTLSSVARLTRRPVTVMLNGNYPEVGIRSFGKGTFHKPAISGADIPTKRLFQIRADDLLFSNVFAWEGAVAVATLADDGRYGSHRFISLVVDRERALPAYLKAWFLTPLGLQQLQHASPGGAGRNRTLGLEALASLRVPLPLLTVQQGVVERINAAAVARSRIDLLNLSIDADLATLRQRGLSALACRFDGQNASALRQTVDMVGGGTPARGDPSFWNGTVPWVTPMDMKSEIIRGARQSITISAVRSSPAKISKRCGDDILRFRSFP